MDQEYDTLLKAYQRMFGMVDEFHFNSQNTRIVYEKYLTIPKESSVVSITHNGVADHRKIRTFNGKILKLGFVGSEAPYKGLPMLKRVIMRLNVEGFENRIKLSVYGGRTGTDGELKNVVYKGRFTPNRMESVYDTMDLLVVPSIWCETFSLTTIEAIQFGVPVLVSSKVGAKDIVKNYSPQFIFETEKDLYEILHRLIVNRSELEVYNRRLVDAAWKWSMEQHAQDIFNQFYKK